MRSEVRTPSSATVAIDNSTMPNVRARFPLGCSAAKMEPAGRHDAAYLPRTTHVTGNVQIHEMGWAADELWFVNTRFSCLCTRSTNHSFVPRWRPRFITELAPEDRCHLNGLAIVGHQPRFVTALGQTNEAGAWRKDKKSGGVLIDVTTDRVIADGLSMPHSPRFHQDRLWVLESGKGEIGIVDINGGSVRPIAQLPGFTRGLTFHGPLAFIGLSQVRESAHFSEIPITDLPIEQRCSGVWIIDTRTGETIAFLKFQDAVQEIFAVEVVERKYPELISDSATMANTFILPDEALAEVTPALRDPASKV